MLLEYFFRNPSTGRKLLTDPQRKDNLRSNPRSQVQNPDQTVSPTTRRRRKALTKALKSLRKKPQRLRRSRRTSLRLSSPLKRSLRTRKPSLPIAKKEKAESNNTIKRSLSLSSTKMNSIKESRVERASSPSDASNNSSPFSPESDDRNEGKSSHESGVSDSDDDVQMQVLEKQVESEKEEDNDSAPEVSLNLPDDTDEESSLLSPSALPASQVFRSPSSRRKKRKSLTEGSTPHKKLENSNPLLTSTPIPSSGMPIPFYKLPAMPISPSLNYTHTHSPSIYTPPAVASRPSSFSSQSQGSLPEKRGRGRPRKALADVKSVSGKLYRKKLAERMTSATVDEQRQAQNIYDFHIEHSDEIEPFSYPALSNPFEDFDPMSAVHHMREFYNYDAGCPSSADLPPDPQHMRHRLHRWGDKSTFVYAKHKFVSNENKFKCDVCEVSFTALSSLKRHYGTIYHKQQEAAGRSTLDLSDILRPDRDGNLMEPGPSSGPPLSYFTGSRGRGRGRPPVARTSSFVRRSAVDNIKKYYALADAARRRRENYCPSAVTTSSRNAAGFTSSWMQKQQRKRKPLHHSDYLYPSASAESEADDFGCEDEDEENIENGNDEKYIDEDSVIIRPWLSNVWKGIGPAHFTCEYCGEVYTRKKQFTRHLFYHRQVEAEALALTCPDCLGVFDTEEQLETHFINFNHGVGVITETRGQKNVQKLECIKCDSKFVRREYYRKHMEIHRRPLLQCPHCTKKFLYKFYLNDHIKAKHDGLTNDLSNIIANDDVAVTGGLPLPTNIVINNVNSTNDITSNMANSNSFPRPKVELFSSTTPLLTPTEPSKRKNQTVGSESNENLTSARNYDVPSTISKKRHSTPAAILVTRDIPIPNFITCDPLMENSTPERTPTRDDYDSKDTENTFEADLTRTLTSTGSSSKGRVSLLQKFLDSQKEQLNQNHSEKDERKNDNDLDNGSSSNSNVVSTSSGLSGIGHSTTEDGKIVFQLEHSMFKGFTSMSSGDGDENACNMSPLTIEIPRDNINLDIEDAASGEDEPKDNMECSKKPDVTPDVEKGVTFHTPIVSPSFHKEDLESEKDRITPFDANNSNSSTVSAFQLLGCGVKSNPPLAVDSGNELQCQDCGKMFEHKKSLIKHVRYYTQMESYSCTLCDRSFKLKHHVSRHMKSYHNVDTSSTTSSTSDDITLEDSGDIDCMNSPSARSDSFLGSGLLVIPSSSSSSVTLSESALSESRKQEPTMLTSPHSRNRTYASIDRPNTGRKRSTSGSAKKKLLEGDHHGPSTSFSKSNYTTVMDSNGSPVFKCLICKKLYPTKNQLNSHLWYHKRSIPYRCNTCSAEFKFKHDLTAHQQDHFMSESTKFTCERCSDRKSFGSRKDFLKHMREIHHYLGRKAPPPPPPTGDSPEKDPLSVSRCPLCPLVFPQESDLHEHISSDHSKKEVVVCRCGQILGSSELLKTHMLQEHQVSGDGTVENDAGLLEQKQDIGDTDKPITTSSQNSPLYIIKQSEPEDELDDEDELDEGEPSSSEFELMDVN